MEHHICFYHKKKIIIRIVYVQPVSYIADMAELVSMLKCSIGARLFTDGSQNTHIMTLNKKVYHTRAAAPAAVLYSATISLNKRQPNGSGNTKPSQITPHAQAKVVSIIGMAFMLHAPTWCHQKPKHARTLSLSSWLMKKKAHRQQYKHSSPKLFKHSRQALQLPSVKIRTSRINKSPNRWNIYRIFHEQQHRRVVWEMRKKSFRKPPPPPPPSFCSVLLILLLSRS